MIGLVGPQERSNKMDEQHRVPNLEEMDKQQAHQFLTELYTVLKASVIEIGPSFGSRGVRSSPRHPKQ